MTVNGGSIKLSLHKGGNRPDVKGDHGIHYVTYSFLPHNSSFNAKAVIQPSYMLNIPHVVSAGEFETASLLKVDKDNIIVESVKPCEDEGRAFVVRLYEAEGTRTNARVCFGDVVEKCVVTNMLEEPVGPISDSNELAATFRPFEIKTVKVYY